MNSIKPYLIRATYDWIVDNQFTPYLAVDTTFPGVIVPPKYIQDNKIVLNVAFHVVNRLALGNELIQFQARFSGVITPIEIPVQAVQALYAKENGHGIAFMGKQIQLMIPLFSEEKEEKNSHSSVEPSFKELPPQKGSGSQKKKLNHLKVIK